MNMEPPIKFSVLGVLTFYLEGDAPSAFLLYN